MLDTTKPKICSQRSVKFNADVKLHQNTEKFRNLLTQNSAVNN